MGQTWVALLDLNKIYRLPIWDPKDMLQLFTEVTDDFVV